MSVTSPSFRSTRSSSRAGLGSPLSPTLDPESSPTKRATRRKSAAVEGSQSPTFSPLTESAVSNLSNNSLSSSSSNNGSTSPSTKSTPRMPGGIKLCYLIICILGILGEFHLIPVYVHMMILTVCTIYIGSYQSVLNHAAGDIITEHMQTKDAYMFPIIGSCVLFSLYCVFKFLPKEYVNLVIKAYFFLFGVLVLTQKFSNILESIIPINTAKSLTSKVYKIKNPFAKKNKPATAAETTTAAVPPTPAPAAANTDDLLEVTILDLYGLLIAITIGIAYLYTNHWLLSNLFGIAFSIQGIELLSLGSYFNGVVLLCGLFIYDIFWVFGTEVMVTVAKNFDAPIKLLFPQTNPALSNSMLGLGDVVIPGIFIALLLRLDYHYRPKSFPIYFTVNLISYFIGLSVTVGVMYHFLAAQPALLYLVPACLGSSLLTALVRGEFKLLWNYTEGGIIKSTEAAATGAAALKTE